MRQISYDKKTHNTDQAVKGCAMVYRTILDAIGDTPLITLDHMTTSDMARIVVKYEGLNVGGSIKTRTAMQMITGAEERGLLDEDSIIVEPTSGNQGIGLALVCAVKGYKAVLIMPDSVSSERHALVAQYGAEVVLVHDEGDIGECIDRCITIAQEMAANDPRVYIPQQFENTDNLKAHETTTAQEILRDIDSSIDGFCAGFGTGGTISGVGKILKEAFPDITIWIAEPENAAILSGGSIGSHQQQGIGDGIIPAIFDTTIYDHICTISDQEAIQTSRELARKEGILCGISSGTNVAIAKRLAKHLGPGKTVVTILPDTGERYFSTELFE